MDIKAFFKIISIDDLIDMAKHNRNLITKCNRLLDNSGSANNYKTILDAIHYYNEISDRNTDENGFIVQRKSIKDLAEEFGFDELSKEQKRHNFEINTAKYKRK